MLGQPRRFNLAARRRGGIAAFSKDDVGAHQRLAGRQVLPHAPIDAAELRGGGGGFLDRRPRDRRGGLAQGRERRVHRLGARGHLAHPERLALAGGDIPQLGNTRFRQRIGCLARVPIERAQRRSAVANLSF